MLTSFKTALSLKTMLRPLAALPAAALFVYASATPVQASQVVFNFAGVAGETSGPTNVGGTANDDANIVTQMQSASELNTAVTGWTVNVLGAFASGAPGGTAGDAGYAADASPNSHVVCSNASSPCVPDSLSTIYNMPFVMTSGSTQVQAISGANAGKIATGSPPSTDPSAIIMNFGGNVSVTSLKFAFEIFPDLTCTTSSCGTANLPDFTFILESSTGSILDESTITATNVGTCGITGSVTGQTPTVTVNSNPKTYSQLSTPETAPQCTGIIDYSSFTGGSITDPTLEFVDWPATIGVTDIDWGLPGVPEPASMALFATGLLGMGLLRRRTQ